MSWVRFPSRAFAQVAQLVERKNIECRVILIKGDVSFGAYKSSYSIDD